MILWRQTPPALALHTDHHHHCRRWSICFCCCAQVALVVGEVFNNFKEHIFKCFRNCKQSISGNKFCDSEDSSRWWGQSEGHLGEWDAFGQVGYVLIEFGLIIQEIIMPLERGCYHDVIIFVGEWNWRPPLSSSCHHFGSTCPPPHWTSRGYYHLQPK